VNKNIYGNSIIHEDEIEVLKVIEDP